MNKILRQQLSVSFEYPVVFTRDLFALSNPALCDVLAVAVEAHPNPRFVVYMDQAVADRHPGLGEAAHAYLAHHLPRLTATAAPCCVPGGEGIKNEPVWRDRLMAQLADARLDRHSFVFAIGGGAMLDAVGYAASLVHRGVRMVRIPTTVLAQDDAGVGVKTAVNDPAGKNFFGTFAPPFAVLNDFAFLDTLAPAEWRGGIAEAFKVALIRDADFFESLCARAHALAARDPAAMEELVVRCAELHLRHIRTSGDPFEQGRARPLDFGHWLAHQLERMSDYRLSHGDAVATGILVDALYASRVGLLGTEPADRLFEALATCGFVLWHPELARHDASGRLSCLEGIESFREHLGGRLCVTMPDGLGRSRELHELDTKLLAELLEELQQRIAAVRT